MLEHTVKAYDKELDTLERRIAEMGGVAEKMVIDAMDALANVDTTLAHEVIATDPRLDALQREIEDLAVMTIARRQPVAVDLRELIGAIRIAGDLERVGDLAKNIAKRTIKVGAEARVPRAIVGLKHMNEVATELLKDVLDAYAQRDDGRAREVWERDVDLDALEDSVFRDLLTHMMEDPRNISFCAHLLFCSKNIERIGDHATNIAETVVYLATGETMPSDRPHRRPEEADRHRRRGRRGRCMNQSRKDIARPGAASAPRILVVEDESDLALLLAYNLEAEGYVVESVERGDEAELRLAENAPDLVILDWMLPGVSGLEICRRLRARETTRTLPVIMVTARGEEAERVRGLSVGADDYVVKPFSIPELMARVRALLRRSRPERIADRLNAGDLDLDRETRRVRRGARDIHLGPTEFRLLEYLLEKPGRVFSRAQLLDGVWGQAAEIDERTVDVHVGRLRKALSRGRERDPIRTVRGTGYAFDETFGKS